MAKKRAVGGKNAKVISIQAAGEVRVAGPVAASGHQNPNERL
jgi:hypothetical protein